MLTLLIPSAALSAPDKYTKYVMNTPVSLHDFAIVHFNKDLDSIFDGWEEIHKDTYTVSGKGAYITYDYKKDTYNLNVYLYGKFIDKMHIKEIRGSLFDRAMSAMGFYKNSKNIYKPIFNNGVTTFTSWMTGEGYSRNDMPNSLHEELNKKVLIRVRVQDGNNEYVCTKELFSDKIMCSE